MGEVRVPARAYYGAQTQRAVENFPISGIRFPRPFIRALGLIKQAAAETNAELGLLPSELGRAIAAAAGEVAEGKFDDQFVLDVFQTGSGTSTNMNANEVIANRAIERLGGTIGSKDPVHPNDHVNLCQSSNDVIPTAIHIAALEEIERRLLPALSGLQKRLAEKAAQFDGIVKIGRTHLQDATPIRLGQEFSGYAYQIAQAITHLKASAALLEELPLGGTAVGTGINRHPEFPSRAIARLRTATGLPFREAENHFGAQGGRDALVAVS
ncbi:MAG TPA: lyase family protein, partial [Limnochordia bacterium]